MCQENAQRDESSHLNSQSGSHVGKEMPLCVLYVGCFENHQYLTGICTQVLQSDDSLESLAVIAVDHIVNAQSSKKYF